MSGRSLPYMLGGLDLGETLDLNALVLIFADGAVRAT